MTPIEVATKYLGVKTGSPMIAKFLASVGLKGTFSWCAAFVVYCTITAAPGSHIPRTGACYRMWSAVKANPFRFQVGTVQDYQWNIWTPQPNDVLIFSDDPDKAQWLGHAEIVSKGLQDHQVASIGGNTTCAGAKGSERSGGCVAAKVRSAGIRGFEMMGMFRER